MMMSFPLKVSQIRLRIGKEEKKRRAKVLLMPLEPLLLEMMVLRLFTDAAQDPRCVFLFFFVTGTGVDVIYRVC